MTLLRVAFCYLATITVAAAAIAVTRRNPVHSVLWMLLVFIHVAILYVFLNADFIAAVQIIVYAGAVLVLFLFVLMLLNLRREDLQQRLQAQWPVGAAVAAAFLVLFGVILGKSHIVAEPGSYTVDFMQAEGNISLLGRVLYSEFLLPFEIASLILLVAILGAVVLAIKKVA